MMFKTRSASAAIGSVVAAAMIGMIGPSASGQATFSPLDVRVVAEVQGGAGNISSNGAAPARRLIAADRLVPGDQIIYTVEIRNSGRVIVSAPVVTQPIPLHVSYIKETASGPGADISFSCDGGHLFAAPGDLMVPTGDGSRTALPSEYTHIRWKLKNGLQPGAVAFAHFRAVVK